MQPIHSNGPKTHISVRFGPFHYCMKVDAKLAELVPFYAQVRETWSRWNFLERMHPIHSIRPKTHILEHFKPFRYCTKVDAKLAELVPLTHKFAKEGRVRIFHNECTQSTPFYTKHRFLCDSDRVVTAPKSIQNWPNWCH
jgi:hypothetical protein